MIFIFSCCWYFMYLIVPLSADQLSPFFVIVLVKIVIVLLLVPDH